MDFNIETVFNNWGQIYTVPGRRIESFLDLNGKKIAVLTEDIHFSALKTMLDGFGFECRFIEADTYETVFGLIESRRVDLGVSNRLVGLQYENQFKISPSPLVFNPVEMRFAAPAGMHLSLLNTLDHHLAALKKNRASIYHQSLNRWFVGPSIASWPRWMVPAAALLIGAVVMLMLLALLLRLQVKTRTKALYTRKIALENEVRERRTTEEALRRSEEKLTQIVNQSSIPTFVLDQHHTITHWNQACVLLTGRKADEVIGTQRQWEPFYPRQRPVLADFILDGIPPEEIARHYTGTKGPSPVLSEAYQAEAFFSHLSPGGKWLYFTAAPIRDARGAVVGAIETLLDFTHAKQAEQALRESERQYRQLFNDLPDVFYRSDLDGNLLLVSPSFTRIFGYPSQEATRLNLSRDFYFNPEDRQLFLAELKRRGYTEGFETRLRHKNGRIIWVSASSRFFRDAQGQPEGIEGIVRDITARKSAENAQIRLSTAIDQSAELILMSDPRGVITYVNPAFEQATGYRASEIIGRLMHRLPNHAQPGVIRGLRDALSRKQAWRGHLTSRKKDGTTFELEATISPIRDRYGSVQNYVAVGRDVTREIMLEQQFKRTQKMEAIGTLAGGIAHDFNNILSAIIGYTEMAKMDAEIGTDLYTHMEKVLLASERARDLVRQILTFSRQGEQERRPLRIGNIIREALKLLRASLPSTIEIRHTLQSRQAVLADPTQIHQIVMNLCTNAAHAMQTEGGVLEVYLTDEAIRSSSAAVMDLKPGNYLKLHITDTGYGIAADHLERIYDPFFTTKKRDEGTGLGLSVVHGIISDCGGTIRVQSEVGQGSAFTIYLPALTAGGTPAFEPDHTMPTGSERILLVDDEPFQTDLGSKLLGRLGYRVTVINSSEEALAIFQNAPHDFDLLITDMTMPKMTGDILAREILTLRPGFPIIISTGYSEHLSIRKAEKIGIRGFAQKPIVLRDLARLIRKALA